jgi:ribosome biogenesis protein ERB1
MCYLNYFYVVSVWEVSTGRCLRTIPVGGVVRSVSWCPNQALALIAVAADRKVLLVNPGVGDHLICSKTDSLLDEAPEQDVVGKA